MLLAVTMVSAMMTAACSSASGQSSQRSGARLSSAQRIRLERGIVAGSVRAESAVLALPVRAAFIQKGRIHFQLGIRRCSLEQENLFGNTVAQSATH